MFSLCLFDVFYMCYYYVSPAIKHNLLLFIVGYGLLYNLFFTVENAHFVNVKQPWFGCKPPPSPLIFNVFFSSLYFSPWNVLTQ
jgi:hypothetical protein